MKPIDDPSQFDDAVVDFFNFEPVKVAKPLKEAFVKAIHKYFMKIDVGNYSYTTYPLKTCYKFQRKGL